MENWDTHDLTHRESYVKILFFRLFAHAEDPDIDEPYKPPVGHVLGKGTLYVTKLNLVLKFTTSYLLGKLPNLVKVNECIGGKERMHLN